jgi:hypothetical protein
MTWFWIAFKAGIGLIAAYITAVLATFVTAIVVVGAFVLLVRFLTK